MCHDFAKATEIIFLYIAQALPFTRRCREEDYHVYRHHLRMLNRIQFWLLLVRGVRASRKANINKNIVTAEF
ncbi:hypothetical protein MTBSS4_110009 [Magnetospirillum sp. SS-4]|nr:hypothetical protein MTBSS4_110009 [Magnetospirillum sp. SS-4]